MQNPVDVPGGSTMQVGIPDHVPHQRASRDEGADTEYRREPILQRQLGDPVRGGQKERTLCVEQRACSTQRRGCKCIVYITLGSNVDALHVHGGLIGRGPYLVPRQPTVRWVGCIDQGRGTPQTGHRALD
jgi:hypothetical protein